MKKKITVERFFEEIKYSAVVLQIGLQDIDSEMMMNLILSICKIKKWRAEMFTFTEKEFTELLKEKGIKINEKENKTHTD
jgi:hypothetical protein